MKSKKGNSWPNIWPEEKVLAMTEIKSAEDIFQILHRVHMDGRWNDKITEKLVCLLAKQNEWKHGHGMELYGFILRQYSDNEMREELLAVSGQSDEYRNIDTPAKRRGEYLTKHADEILIEPNSMEKKEKKVLYRISKDIYRDFSANEERLLRLLQEWATEVGLDPKTLEAPDIPRKREKPQTQGNQKEIRPVFHKHKKFKGAKKDKKGFGEKTRILVNIIMPIKISYTKVAIETPLYGVLILSLILVISIPMFSTFYQQNMFLKRLWNATVESPGAEKVKIESITVDKKKVEVKPGETENPYITVMPVEAGKSNLRSKSDDKSIATMTQEWEVIGGYGWQEDSDNTTIITLWGDGAEPVEIEAHLEPGYVDGADKDIPVDGGAGEWQ